MPTIRNWQGMKDKSSRLLVERTEVLGWLQQACEQNRW